MLNLQFLLKSNLKRFLKYPSHFKKENAHQTAGILTYGVQQNHNKSTV